jgi:hypothetical protein
VEKIRGFHYYLYLREGGTDESYLGFGCCRQSDDHGTPAQRAYNVLCMAYGADPKLFGDFVTKGYLPKKRAAACGDEYDQVSYAFERLVGPHIDRARAKGILDKSWIPEATTRLPRRIGSPQPPQAQ